MAHAAEIELMLALVCLHILGRRRLPFLHAMSCVTHLRYTKMLGQPASDGLFGMRGVHEATRRTGQPPHARARPPPSAWAQVLQQAQDAQQMCGAAFLACWGEWRGDSTRRGLTEATRAARRARGDAGSTVAAALASGSTEN